MTGTTTPTALLAHLPILLFLFLLIGYSLFSLALSYHVLSYSLNRMRAFHALIIYFVISAILWVVLIGALIAISH